MTSYHPANGVTGLLHIRLIKGLNYDSSFVLLVKFVKYLFYLLIRFMPYARVTYGMVPFVDATPHLAWILLITFVNLNRVR